jgi:hypothetical protein
VGLFPNLRSQLLFQRRHYIVLKSMQFESKKLKGLIPSKNKNDTAGTSILRSLIILNFYLRVLRQQQPMRSSGQSSWLKIQRSRV